MHVLLDEVLDHFRDINNKLTANERETEREREGERKRERERASFREPVNYSRDVSLKEEKRKQTVVLLLMSLLILFSFGRSWISSHSTKIDNELRHPLSVDGNCFLSRQFIFGQNAIGHMVLRQCAVYCSLCKCNFATFCICF